MDTARNFLSNCPPPAESLALLLGVAQLSIFGLAGLADPDGWAIGYGTPITSSSAPAKAASSDEEADPQIRTQRALVTATAARNITNGMLILGLGAWLRDRRALGLAIACNVITTVADTLIVRAYGVADRNGEKNNGASHLIGVVNSTAVGLALFRWGRNDPWW